MKNSIKNIYFSLPRSLRVFILRTYEDCVAFYTAKRLGIKIDYTHYRTNTGKPRVLFFDRLGGGHSGMSKHMQTLARYLDKSKYDVFFMYSTQRASNRAWADGTAAKGENADRAKILSEYGVTLIEFTYDSIEDTFPYVIKGIKPDFFTILKEKNIDILIVITDGKSSFPSNLVRNIPIILLNVFGSYSVQKNIAYNVCYTQELVHRIDRVVDEGVVRQLYLPCQRPPLGSMEDGRALRERLGIKNDDVVFGRIGRDVDQIFDTIGIRAFKKVVAAHPETHLLVVSPPPALEKVVADERIPNVHLLPPTADDKEIGAFHQANDVYAHFRKDGETFGLNIAEAMMCGKPIITHRSFMWNGHLEYLEPAFSRVADIDDWETYATYMEEYIELKKKSQLESIGLLAKQKAEKEFLPEHIIEEIESLIDSALKK